MSFSCTDLISRLEVGARFYHKNDTYFHAILSSKISKDKDYTNDIWACNKVKFFTNTSLVNLNILFNISSIMTMFDITYDIARHIIDTNNYSFKVTDRIVAQLFHTILKYSFALDSYIYQSTTNPFHSLIECFIGFLQRVDQFNVEYSLKYAGKNCLSSEQKLILIESIITFGNIIVTKNICEQFEKHDLKIQDTGRFF